MTHKLCKKCINTCKQEENVKIARCPKFEKRVSNREFNDLVDDLEIMGEKADDLHTRTKKLINTALEGYVSMSDNGIDNTEK